MDDSNDGCVCKLEKRAGSMFEDLSYLAHSGLKIKACNQSEDSKRSLDGTQSPMGNIVNNPLVIGQWILSKMIFPLEMSTPSWMVRAMNESTGIPYIYGTDMDPSFIEAKGNLMVSFSLSESSLSLVCSDREQRLRDDALIKALGFNILVNSCKRCNQ